MLQRPSNGFVGEEMRAIIFYPVVAIVAAATIVVSLNTAILPRPVSAQVGVAKDGAVVFDADALAHVAISGPQEFYLLRDGDGTPKGIQLATPSERMAPEPADRGVQILLAPQTAAPFAGKALRVELRVRPLLYTTAPKVAVSAQTAGPAQWVTQTFPHTVIERAGDDPAKTSAWLQFDLPAQAAAPQAIGIWPYDDRERKPNERFYYNAGIEVLEVRVSLAPPRTAAANTGESQTFAVR